MHRIDATVQDQQCRFSLNGKTKDLKHFRFCIVFRRLLWISSISYYITKSYFQQFSWCCFCTTACEMWGDFGQFCRCFDQVWFAYKTRNTFCGTWYLPHSWFHYDGRCRFVFMSQLLAYLQQTTLLLTLARANQKIYDHLYSQSCS